MNEESFLRQPYNHESIGNGGGTALGLGGGDHSIEGGLGGGIVREGGWGGRGGEIRG